MAFDPMSLTVGGCTQKDVNNYLRKQSFFFNRGYKIIVAGLQIFSRFYEQFLLRIHSFVRRFS